MVMQELLHEASLIRLRLPLRWLTMALEDYGRNGYKGTALAEWMVKAIWEAAALGKITWPDGTVMEVRPREALDAARFIMERIEGSPVQRIEVGLVRTKAKELAEQYGLNADELIAEAERLALPGSKGE